MSSHFFSKFPYEGESTFALILLALFNCQQSRMVKFVSSAQGGITCGAIDEPRKSSKVIDERVIINFCDKNVINARFRDKNKGFIF